MNSFRTREIVRRELNALLREMTPEEARELIAVPPRYKRYLDHWRKEEPEIDGMVRRALARRDLMLEMLEQETT